MKVHVLYDKQGNVISVGVPLPLSYDFRGPAFGPKAAEDQHAGEFEVPEEYAMLKLPEFADKLRVDVQAKIHKLVAKR